MDILTALDSSASYSKTQLQLILGAWVLASALEPKRKISTDDGDVNEADYSKLSIYSLLYALYRAMGEVRSETGEPYEFTFNTWGYAWPSAWGPSPTSAGDPQRFGKNAYAGLFQFDAVRTYVAQRGGHVHVIELGCGTGAGAHHVCSSVLPRCTYEAVDMQQAAIDTCRRKFVPALGGRLASTCADATTLRTPDETADFIAVNETHVTEQLGRVTEEDQRFFRTAARLLKPGAFLTWGNAIPNATWRPCFDFLRSIGLEVREVREVTTDAVRARDEDKARIDAYVEQCLRAFHGFRIPLLGSRKRAEAELALKNFSRNPGTRLYGNMRDGTDTYKVVLVQKPA
jgi:ubiquinone/menaquinone biosynthesis C-methylase UbiE